MSLKDKLIKNELTIGSWITIGHHSIAEIMATAGFDWLTIDMEHSAITIEKSQELILAIKSTGATSLVRVGLNDDLIIKQVMDAGADGVIVPMVCSKKDAERAVNAVKYPPNGNRGVGLARAQNYGLGFEEYKNWLKKDSVVIAQIEHKEAVKNIKDIIQVDGIDGIIIGPYDMSASFGIPGELDSPILLDAIKQTEQACRDANFPLGFHVIKPDHAEIIDKISLGYTFLGFSLDFLFLGDKARYEMEKIKND